MLRLLFWWFILLIGIGEKVETPAYRLPIEHVGDPSNEVADLFSSPLKRAISVSGTFGELRSNHFHAGLDIKSSNGQVGEPIYAAAKGYVSRIKISAYGYGRALYLTHPNGHTTVYGHLDRFMPELEQYIDKEHYKRQRFELDLSLTATTFPVTQGQIIAYLGNTGSSTGPHLHFEVRNSMTEEVLNPLEFGISVKDTDAPKIFSLKVYGKQQGIPFPLMTLPVINKISSRFELEQDTILVNSDFAGMAIKTYDQSFQSSQRLGVYGIKLFVDESLQYEFDMNTFSFDQMRYSNAHRDYEEQSKSRQVYHRLFRLAGNKLPIYQKKDDGWISLPGSTDGLRRIRIEVYDHENNKSEIKLFLKRIDGPPKSLPGGSQLVSFDQPFSMQKGEVKIDIPANRLYTDTYLDYSTQAKENSYSLVHKIHDPSTPLHRSYKLAIKPSGLPANLMKKAVIASISGNSVSNQGGKWNGDWLETNVNSFGSFAVKIDTIPPTIKPVTFKTDMTKNTYMKFKISDNFGVSGDAKELVYDAYIDGQWILMALDSRNDVITHRFDYRTKSGKHSLRIQVKDDRGNTKTFVQTFLK